MIVDHSCRTVASAAARSAGATDCRSDSAAPRKGRWAIQFCAASAGDSVRLAGVRWSGGPMEEGEASVGDLSAGFVTASPNRPAADASEAAARSRCAAALARCWTRD